MVNLIAVLLIVRSFSLRLEDSIILTSTFTPEPLKEFCYGLYSVNLSEKTLSSVSSIISQFEFLFIVDFTFSQSFNAVINSISEYFEAPYLSIFKSNSTFHYRVELHNDLQSEANSILSLLSAFKLASFTIVTSPNIRDIELASYLKVVTKNEYFSYSDNISEEYANNFVLKILKSSGVNTVILIDSSESSSKFEAAIVNKNWMKNGAIIIYSVRTPSKLKTIGTIQVCESGTESFSSIYEFHFKAVLNFVQVINRKLEIVKKTSELTRSVLLQIAKDYNPELNIVNFQSEVKVVGKYNKSTKEVNISSNLIFPGNTSNFNLQIKSQIVLSIANGTHDPYYSFTYDYLAYLYQGSNYAVYRSNLLNEIPNFELVLAPNDCGIFWYEPYWYQSCFSTIVNKMGIGFITSFFGDAIKGNAYTLRGLNKVIPQVSPLGTDDEIESTENFPEILKLETSTNLYTSSRFYTLFSLGYKDLIVLASNDTSHLSTYIRNKEFIEMAGLRIVNDENSRFIDYKYTRDNFSVYEDLFKRLKNTYCTVYYILTLHPEHVLEALYDVGLRKGDFVFFHDTSLVSYLDNIEEPYLTKRKELIQGALVFSYREWSGTLGSTLKKELSEKYSELTYMCMTYDTVSVFKEAIKYVLTLGEDIENYSVLMKAARLNRFIGCLGNVFFSGSGNSRSSAQLLIQQIYYNESFNALKTEDVAYYDRFGTQLLTQINQYSWPNGEKPPNYRPLSECGFEPRKEQNSSEGKKVLYIICVILFMSSLISGLLCIWCYKQSFEELEERKVISFGDFIFYAFFVLEFLQILTIGPDQDAYTHIVGNLQILLSFDLNSFFSFKFSKFWMLFYGVFSVSLLCAIFLLLRLTKLEAFIPSIIKDKYQLLADFILLIIGHLLFLPILSMLLNIFSCYRSTGDALTDSIFDRDCKKNCYTGIHKTISICTSLLLFALIFMGTFYRPSVQYLNPDQNIKIKSKFLVFQTWIHLLLVIFNKTLKIENQTTHGIVVIIILLGYLLGVYIMKPYNFQRPFIGHCFFIIGALWCIFTSVLFREVGSITAWIVVEFVGLAIIAIIGLVVFKRSVEMLYSAKGKDISTLFLFQCLKNYEKYIKDFESIDFLKGSKYQMGDSSKLSS